MSLYVMRFEIELRGVLKKKIEKDFSKIKINFLHYVFSKNKQKPWDFFGPKAFYFKIKPMRFVLFLFIL